ncbi:MAG: hypothetical protein EXR77_19395 [Myxococcales bacterium]|nr:hypothetical protein [Myxococcales bacterium]
MRNSNLIALVACLAGLGLCACESKPTTPVATADTATAIDAAVSADGTTPADGGANSDAKAADAAGDAPAGDGAMAGDASTAADTVVADMAIAADTAVVDMAAVDTGAEVAPGNPCTAAGGTIATQKCCSSASDYPNTCAIGACGCGPAASKDVATCNCGAGKCWDGKVCVKQ